MPWERHNIPQQISIPMATARKNPRMWFQLRQQSTKTRKLTSSVDASRTSVPMFADSCVDGSHHNTIVHQSDSIHTKTRHNIDNFFLCWTSWNSFSVGNIWWNSWHIFQQHRGNQQIITQTVKIQVSDLCRKLMFPIKLIKTISLDASQERRQHRNHIEWYGSVDEIGFFDLSRSWLLLVFTVKATFLPLIWSSRWSVSGSKDLQKHSIDDESQFDAE